MSNVDVYDFGYYAEKKLKSIAREANEPALKEIRELKKLHEDSLKTQKQTLAAMQELTKAFNRFCDLVVNEVNAPTKIMDMATINVKKP